VQEKLDFSEKMRARLKQLIAKHYGNARGALAQFSDDVGKKPGNVADWLNDKKKSIPSAEVIARLCELFPEEIFYLLTGYDKDVLKERAEKLTQKRKLIVEMRERRGGLVAKIDDAINAMDVMIDLMIAEKRPDKEIAEMVAKRDDLKSKKKDLESSTFKEP
jgi:transcriptional regulator with XRE-family HTH domain